MLKEFLCCQCVPEVQARAGCPHPHVGMKGPVEGRLKANLVEAVGRVCPEDWVGNPGAFRARNDRTLELPAGWDGNGERFQIVSGINDGGRGESLVSGDWSGCYQEGQAGEDQPEIADFAECIAEVHKLSPIV